MRRCTAHMAAIFLAKVDRKSLLYPYGTIQWWLSGQLKIWWSGGKRRVWGIRIVKQTEKFDNVKVSTHNWWSFTAVAPLEFERFTQRVRWQSLKT